jgi:hypothetical protein
MVASRWASALASRRVGSWSGPGRQRDKERRRATGPAWTYTDPDVEAYVDQLVSITMDKERDAAAWYASVSRYAREPHHGGLYDRGKVASCAQRLMMGLFPTWPPQEPPSGPPTETSAGATGTHCGRLAATAGRRLAGLAGGIRPLLARPSTLSLGP